MNHQLKSSDISHKVSYKPFIKNFYFKGTHKTIYRVLLVLSHLATFQWPIYNRWPRQYQSYLGKHPVNCSICTFKVKVFNKWFIAELLCHSCRISELKVTDAFTNLLASEILEAGSSWPCNFSIPQVFLFIYSNVLDELIYSCDLICENSMHIAI